jgi:hypothetical protein
LVRIVAVVAVRTRIDRGTGTHIEVPHGDLVGIRA